MHSHPSPLPPARPARPWNHLQLVKDIQDALNYLDSHYTFSQDQESSCRRRLHVVVVG
jgi:hypothetical protein